MTKILFYTGGMNNSGGAERVISNLSNAFIQTNEVHIITTGLTQPAYPLNSDIQLYSLDNNKNKINHFFFKKNLARIIRLYKYIVKYNPDIIITFLPNEIDRILFLNFFLRRKVIVSLRDDPVTEYKSYLRKILIKTLINNASGIIFQTEQAQSFFNKKIKQKSCIIPNPINPDFIAEPFLGKRKKVIVTAGRLTNQKNHKLLINAFKSISNTYDEYMLYIYGDGPLKDELQKLISNYKLEHKIFLKGSVSDLKDQIYDASLFVLSSNHEGMPNALLEAMALGLPVISTDCPCGGPAFLIKDSINGLLVDVNNESQLINAMKRILESPLFAENLGKNASYISETLNPQKIISLWDNFIRSTI